MASAVKKSCLLCGVGFAVHGKRATTAKYCCRACSDAAPRVKNQTRCAQCGSLFGLKKTSVERNKVWGSFCSPFCSSAFREKATAGSGNPNFKGRTVDSDGYRIYSPAASLTKGFGKVKEHQAAALTAIGEDKPPAGMHVHHRDCNRLNNAPSNLAWLTVADHVWLHRQFGVATLAAFCQGKVSITDLCSWSDEPPRAYLLLSSSVEMQSVILDYLKGKMAKVDIGNVAALRPQRACLVEVSEFGSTGA